MGGEFIITLMVISMKESSRMGKEMGRGLNITLMAINSTDSTKMD